MMLIGLERRFRGDRNRLNTLPSPAVRVAKNNCVRELQRLTIVKGIGPRSKPRCVPAFSSRRGHAINGDRKASRGTLGKPRRAENPYRIVGSKILMHALNLDSVCSFE